MTRTEVRELITMLAAAWPAWAAKVADKQSARLLTDLWAATLGDVELADAIAAVQVHLATSEWPPTVAAIRKAVTEAKRPPSRAGAEAWGDVLRACQRWGAGGSPRFDDPVVASVVASLGWRELCLSENVTADRARFIAAYEEIRDRVDLDARLPETMRRLDDAGRPKLGSATPLASALRLHGGGE